MAAIQNIKIALESAVKSAFPTDTIAWDNVVFSSPTDGSFWMAVNIIVGTPNNSVMGDAFYIEMGLLQITLSYPVNGGSGKAYSKAGDVQDAFKRGSSFTKNGT